LWYNATTMLPAGSLEAEGLTRQCPKQVELIGIINKLLLLHLVGFYIIYNTSC
jgi:hypothetical protein